MGAKSSVYIYIFIYIYIYICICICIILVYALLFSNIIKSMKNHLKVSLEFVFYTKFI